MASLPTKGAQTILFASASRMLALPYQFNAKRKNSHGWHRTTHPLRFEHSGTSHYYSPNVRNVRGVLSGVTTARQKLPSSFKLVILCFGSYLWAVEPRKLQIRTEALNDKLMGYLCRAVLLAYPPLRASLPASTFSV